MPCIYKVTNNINGKVYIGKTTKTVEQRFRRHCYDCRYQGTIFHKALLKYGAESFSLTVLEEVSEFDLNAREKFWIAKLSPEYNLTIGGTGGDTSKSPNFQKAMRKRNFYGSKNPMFGKRNSHPCSPETAKKISLARLGKPHPHKAHRHTEVTKQKLREAALKQHGRA